MRPRLRDLGFSIGEFPVGPLNRITDVDGLLVGHLSLISDVPSTIRTGVTVVNLLEDPYEKPISAGVFVLNGYGKSAGLIQVEELGQLETPVVLTSTLAVGFAFEGVVRNVLEGHPGARSVNPLVLECNDGFLNDITRVTIRPEHVIQAMNDSCRSFMLGSVGAGTGMVSFGYKGGIGSSSRVVTLAGRTGIIGALVLNNYGRPGDLRFLGKRVIAPSQIERSPGSIIVLLATDLPLTSRQLKRLCRHAMLALGRVGTPGYTSSGDICVALSTGLRWKKEGVFEVELISDSSKEFDALFAAAVDAVEESIYDSLLCSETMDGYKGRIEAIDPSFFTKGRY